MPYLNCGTCPSTPTTPSNPSCDCSCGSQPSNGCSQPNRTANYGLPLWKASDVTSWLMQMNGAMMKIDDIMHQLALRTGIDGVPTDVVETVAQMQQDVCRIKTQICEMSTSVSNNNLQVANVMTAMGNVQSDITSLQMTATNLDTRLVTAETRLGNLTTDVQVVKKNTATAMSTVEAISTNVQEMLNTLQEMQDQFSLQASKIANLETDVSAVTKKVDDLLETKDNISLIFTKAFLQANSNPNNYITDEYAVTLNGVASNMRNVIGDIYTVDMELSLNATDFANAAKKLQAAGVTALNGLYLELADNLDVQTVAGEGSPKIYLRNNGTVAYHSGIGSSSFTNINGKVYFGIHISTPAIGIGEVTETNLFQCQPAFTLNKVRKKG